MGALITEAVVRQQLSAMHCDRYEIGVLKKSGVMSLCENQDIERICRGIKRLRRENALGAHIFVRPSWPHSLTMIDDLSHSAIAEMRETGFEPVVVVETSPNNFQAWLNHGQTLSDRFLSTLAAKQLALRFRGDCGSADWRHFGRLAGFTNQKKERRLENGLQPFVKLPSCGDRVYSKAVEFLREAAALRDKILSQRESQKIVQRRTTGVLLRSISSFHDDPRYGGDLHRADMAWALHAAGHGLSREQIQNEILAARDLSKKGAWLRQLDYVARTVNKAIANV